MSVVYGLLYMLVPPENYALLLGAVILFAALAGVMLVTRRPTNCLRKLREMACDGTVLSYGIMPAYCGRLSVISNQLALLPT